MKFINFLYWMIISSILLSSCSLRSDSVFVLLLLLLFFYLLITDIFCEINTKIESVYGRLYLRVLTYTHKMWLISSVQDILKVSMRFIFRHFLWWYSKKRRKKTNAPVMRHKYIHASFFILAFSLFFFIFSLKFPYICCSCSF